MHGVLTLIYNLKLLNFLLHWKPVIADGHRLIRCMPKGSESRNQNQRIGIRMKHHQRFKMC